MIQTQSEAGAVSRSAGVSTAFTNGTDHAHREVMILAIAQTLFPTVSMIIMIVGGLAGAWSLTIGCSHRDDVVLLSAEEYQRLRSLDRRAMHVSELSDDELAALDAVEIPAEATRYNHEMTCPWRIASLPQ